jgi:hypothetical protein
MNVMDKQLIASVNIALGERNIIESCTINKGDKVIMHMEIHIEEFNILKKRLEEMGITINLEPGITKEFNWVENKDGSIEAYIDGRIIIKGVNKP